MPQVDHRIGQGLERVMQLAEALESKEQPAKLIFPAEHPLDGIEAFLENGGVEERLPASFDGFSAAGVWVDVRYASVCHRLVYFI